MTMNKYFVGAVAGATSLVIAFPVAAQLASAAGPRGSSENVSSRPAPSQACVQALADNDGTFLASIDVMIAAHKSAVLTHKNALTVAAGISDDAARKAAVVAANEAFRTTMMTAKDSQKDAHTAERDALKAACGTSMGFGMMNGHFYDGDEKNLMKRGRGFHMNKGGFGRGQSFGGNREG